MFGKLLEGGCIEQHKRHLGVWSVPLFGVEDICFSRELELDGAVARSHVNSPWPSKNEYVQNAQSRVVSAILSASQDINHFR